MENGVYDSYWTEKITDCFATGTIPIYWGTKSKRLFDFFKSDGIIILESLKEQEIMESLTTELYESKLKAVHANLERVKDMKIADDYLWDILK